jgi:flagellar protein FliL
LRLRVSDISERRRIGGAALAAAVAAMILVVAGGAAAQHAKPNSNKGEKGPVIEGPTFVQMRPIILPIVEGNRVTRTAGVILVLELEKGKTEAELEPSRTKLVDAFITELYTFIDQHKESPRAIDAAAVKVRLQATSDRILGPGFVHEVLVQQAFERPRKP